MHVVDLVRYSRSAFDPECDLGWEQQVREEGLPAGGQLDLLLPTELHISNIRFSANNNTARERERERERKRWRERE